MFFFFLVLTPIKIYHNFSKMYVFIIQESVHMFTESQQGVISSICSRSLEKLGGYGKERKPSMNTS